jgi:hypothetical protein
MHIEFDAVTSYVYSPAKTGQRIFRRKSRSASMANHQERCEVAGQCPVVEWCDVFIHA